MTKFLPSFILGLRKESGLSTNVAEADHTNKEKLLVSSDGRRKYTISLFYQVGDPEQPIQSIRLSALTDTFGGWGNIMTIERSRREDGTFSYIYLDIPTGVNNGAMRGIEGGYDGNGVLQVNIQRTRFRWFSLGESTPEADMFFKLHELPKQIDMRKTLEVFAEQFHHAESSKDLKYFQKPVLFPAIAGDISKNASPALTQ